jgi:hypothetical protein
MIRAFRKIKSTIQELNQVQENIEQTLRSVLQTPILNGVLLTNIDLVTGAVNRVPHKLGRELRGYFIVKKNSAATIYDTQSSLKADENFLLLNTSANTNVNIWIF